MMTGDLGGHSANAATPEQQSERNSMPDPAKPATESSTVAGTGGDDVLIGQGTAEIETIDRPAAGDVVNVPTEPGERYEIAFDPDEARVEVAGENLVLIFPDGGRVVMLDLVENAIGDNPPVLQIDDMEVAANLLVAQALRLAENAPTLETAAAPPPVPSSGISAYSDNFGDILGLLAPQGVIPGVSLQFGLIDLPDSDLEPLQPLGADDQEEPEPEIIEARDDASAINPGSAVLVDALANDTSSSDELPAISRVEIVNGMGTAEVVDGRIRYHSAIEDENSVVELRYTLGDGDPETSASVFVTIGDYEHVHDFYAADGSEFRNSDGVTFDSSISEEGPIPVGDLSEPLQVDASLYPNETVTIQIQANSVGLPQMLDLYLIQDVTGSFQDDMSVIRGAINGNNDAGDLGLLGDLVASVTGKIADTNFGLGTFRDIHREPWEEFGNPHEFESVLKLGGAGSPAGSRLDGDPDGPGYDELDAFGGGALKETQFKALSEVALDAALASTDDPATTASDLGFRMNAAKVAVIITDSTSYEDVSRVELRSQLMAAGLIPIFLVGDGEETGNTEFEFYEQLVDELGFGAVLPLSASSTNLVDAITEGLTQVFQPTLHIEGDDNGYAKIVDMQTVGGITTWTVELAAPADDAKIHGNDDITFRVSGEDGVQIGEEIVVSVDTTVEIQGTDNYDTLTGHNGENVIVGNAGDDVLTGLGGADTFVLDLGTDSGNDTVTDFNRAEDILSFTDVVDQGAPGLDVADVDAAIVDIVNGGAGKDVVVNFESGGSLTVQGAGIGPAGTPIDSIASLVDDPANQVQVA